MVDTLLGVMFPKKRGGHPDQPRNIKKLTKRLTLSGWITTHDNLQDLLALLLTLLLIELHHDCLYVSGCKIERFFR